MNQKALIIKGFARGFDMIKNQKHKNAAESVVNMAENYDIIAWDGDKLKQNSFTQVIQAIMNRYGGNKTYKAFRKNNENKLGYKEGVVINITKLENIPQNNYLTLGKKAFETLKNQGLNISVVFLGLGHISSQEYNWLNEGKINKKKKILHNLSKKS